jgi:NDP-sugar pyrophosphorylase family protein
MAGLGSRFSRAGFTVPKPLIEVRGRPMYALAVDSLPLEHATRLVFVLLSSQPEFGTLRADILERYAQYDPIVLDVPTPTEGQAITVLRACEWINEATPLLIHNADTAFVADPNWTEEASRTGCDGALAVFQSAEPRWSFSREDESGRVVEVQEKQVISPWASTGTYWFRHGADFVRLARVRELQGRREAAEYYVAPLYNDLIEEGGHVRNFLIEQIQCFGTPEDYLMALKALADDGLSPFE